MTFRVRDYPLLSLIAFVLFVFTYSVNYNVRRCLSRRVTKYVGFSAALLEESNIRNDTITRSSGEWRLLPPFMLGDDFG